MRNAFFALFSILALAGGCGSKGNGIDLISKGNRLSAPELGADYINASGANLTLAQLKGKVVLVDFWATWCGPCRMELPSLVKLYQTYHPQGLEMLGLSVERNDGKSIESFREFLAQYQINYPVGLASLSTLQNYGINPIPTAFFIDKNGKVALSMVGAHPEEDFVGAIEKLLEEKAD